MSSEVNGTYESRWIIGFCAKILIHCHWQSDNITCTKLSSDSHCVCSYLLRHCCCISLYVRAFVHWTFYFTEILCFSFINLCFNICSVTSKHANCYRKIICSYMEVDFTENGCDDVSTTCTCACKSLWEKYFVLEMGTINTNLCACL